MPGFRGVAALCGALAASAAADVIQVPADAPTIQAGIDLATDGDEVVVADGVHAGTGNRDIDFHGKSISVRSASADPSLCVIDCQELGRGFIFQSGETAAARVEGFTITNGNVGPTAGGGGMYVNGSCPAITNCVFNDNSAATGGGIFNVFSCPEVSGCTFVGNDAVGPFWGGGGMDNYASDPLIADCAFIDNQTFPVVGGGGGIANRNGSAPTIRDCTFNGNMSHEGGAMLNDESSPSVTGCLFVGNSSAVEGLGEPLLTNCIVAFNLDPGPGELYVLGNAALVNCTVTGNGNSDFSGFPIFNEGVTLTNCIVWDNAAQILNGTASYSDVDSLFIALSGPGNIIQDPMFVDPGALDFRPAAQSPVIDRGSNLAVPPGVVTDFDGNPRFVDDPAIPDQGLGTPPIVDMGAFERQPPPCVGDVDGDGSVGIGDFLALLAAWGPNSGHPADLDGDGLVGITDFLDLLAHWGPCP